MLIKSEDERINDFINFHDYFENCESHRDFFLVVNKTIKIKHFLKCKNLNNMNI